MTWEEFHCNASVDRVSGDLPGSFISWSPENRFVRLVNFFVVVIFFSFLKTSIIHVTLSTNFAFPFSSAFVSKRP